MHTSYCTIFTRHTHEVHQVFFFIFTVWMDRTMVIVEDLMWCSAWLVPKPTRTKEKTSCPTWKPNVLLFVLFAVSQVASARGFLLAPHETRVHTESLGLGLSGRHQAVLNPKTSFPFGKSLHPIACSFFCDSDVQVLPNIPSTFIIECSE